MASKYPRKKYFINKKLQIRYMITFTVPMLFLLLFIGIIMYLSQKTFLTASAEHFSGTIYDIIQSGDYMNEDSEKKYQSIVDQITSRLANMEGLALTKDMMGSSYKILTVGLLIVLIQIAFITIFLSHKIAGPAYRLLKFSEDILAGNYASRIVLRKGDQLTDVADHLNESANKTSKIIISLCEIIEKLEKNPGPEELKDLLKNCSNLL